MSVVTFIKLPVQVHLQHVWQIKFKTKTTSYFKLHLQLAEVTTKVNYKAK